MTDAVSSEVSVTSLSAGSTPRSQRPVFVMGCHRSGTNLLYDTLMSAGGFALYNGYLPVYKLLVPRFGHPRHVANRIKMVDAFLQGTGFARTGLDAAELRARLVADCKTGGDFMRIVMEEICQRQGVRRWALYDPDNVLHVAAIKADIPDALFIHIIRDGRDIALSLLKMGGYRPYPWNRKSAGLMETALYWEWMVQTGQRYGRGIPGDYIEISYEKLVTEPRSTLTTLSRFLAHDLDYDRIQRAGVGRLRESNSSFLGEAGAQEHPVNRWKQKLSPAEIAGIEAIVGHGLEQSGYELTTAPERRHLSLWWRAVRSLYPLFLETKLWLKLRTPVGRLSSLAPLDLTVPPDHSG